ncbi:hypothetical protein [Paenibacillus harenae]|nr:hypothetical protein [Paenibacillus harenae]
MRSILITLLLLVTVILLYLEIAEGDTGMNRQVNEAGRAVSDHIRSMSP